MDKINEFDCSMEGWGYGRGDGNGPGIAKGGSSVGDCSSHFTDYSGEGKGFGDGVGTESGTGH